jgi:chromosome segregation ATPase
MDMPQAVENFTNGLVFLGDRMFALGAKAHKYKKRAQAQKATIAAMGHEMKEMEAAEKDMRWEIEQMWRAMDRWVEWERELEQDLAVLERENAELRDQNCNLRVVDWLEGVAAAGAGAKRAREESEGEVREPKRAKTGEGEGMGGQRRRRRGRGRGRRARREAWRRGSGEDDGDIAFISEEQFFHPKFWASDESMGTDRSLT